MVYCVFLICFIELMRALMSTLMISLCNTARQEERRQMDMSETSSSAYDTSLDCLSVI